MTTWPRVTENLVLQNSNMVIEHGGRIGATDWSYCLDHAGVRTIDPSVAFYLNPPRLARCRWSTNSGQRLPKHIIPLVSNGNAMPPRHFVQWNQDMLDRKFNEFRAQYWEDLKDLIRPNNFEDLYELFDASTLWANGAYNLWIVVNMLVTHAHNEYPQVLQEWKAYLDQVVHDLFRIAPGPQQSDSLAAKSQLEYNQSVLASWDQTMDPLLLLQHTNFHMDELHHMTIQQHGLLRDSMVLEHATLTGVLNTIPRTTDCNPSVNSQAQGAPAPNAVQPMLRSTTTVKSPSRDPVIAVGSIPPHVQETVGPQEDSCESAAVAGRASPPTLDSIPEEPVAAKAKTAVQVELAEAAVTVPEIETVEQAVSTIEIDPFPVGPCVPEIVTREPTPAPDSPIRDRKDSIGSTDKLFFPDAPAPRDKLHAARQASVTSAPDFDSTPMLTAAEKNEAQPGCKTPRVVQINHDHHPLPSRPESAAGTPTRVDAQGPYQVPVVGRNEGRQHFTGPPNTFPALASGMQSVPNGLVAHSGGLQAPTVPLMGPHAGSHVAPHMAPYAASSMLPFQEQLPPHMPQSQFGPHGFHAQMSASPPFMGPPSQCLSAGYQPNGYVQQPQNHGTYGEKGNRYRGYGYKDSWYSSNGHNNPSHNRNNGNGNYQRGGKRSDSNHQSNGSFKARGNPTASAANGQPRQMGGSGTSTRRLSTVSRPDQNNGRGGGQLRLCNNRTLREYAQDNVMTKDILYGECPCWPCQQATRSIYIVRGTAATNEDAASHDLLRHFSIFRPVNASKSGAVGWLVEFKDDFEACAALQWAHSSPENWPSGHISVWYPRFSKHYTPASGNPVGLSRQAFELQTCSQMVQVNASAHREPNPYYGQRPMDLASSYGGSTQNNFQSPAFNGQMCAPDLVPAQGMVYQQMPAHVPPRELYDPNAPPPHAKFKQQSRPKSNSSEKMAVRRSQIMGVDTWRCVQTKLPSEEAIVDEENDAADTIEDAASSHSSVKVSAPPETGSAVEAVARAASQSVSLEKSDKVRDMTAQNSSRTGEDQSQETQMKHLPQKETLKPKSRKKSQQEKSHKHHAATAGPKTSEKSGDGASFSSMNGASQDPNTAQQSQPSTATRPSATVIADQDPKKTPSSKSATTDTAKEVRHDDKRTATEAEPTGTENDTEETASSSLTTAPGTTEPTQPEIKTHLKKTTAKNSYDAAGKTNAGKSTAGETSKKNKKNQKNKGSEAKQSGYRKTAADLTVSVERFEDERSKSRPASEASSAVEAVSYPTDTVIRRKPDRPTLPVSWADDANNELPPTTTPSPPDGTLPESTVADRFSELRTKLANVGVNVRDVTQPLFEDAMAHVLAPLAEKASESNEIPAPKDREGAMDDNMSEPIATESAPQADQKPKSSRKKNKGKSKAQGAPSQLTSRSNTPALADTQSRGPSPTLNRPSSAAAFSNASSRGPSPAMEHSTKPKQHRQQKNQRKRDSTLDVSEGLKKSGGSRDNKEHGAATESSSQDQQTLHEKPGEKDTAPATAAVSESQAKPVHEAGKSDNAKFRANTAGNSLRIAKQRSPKKSAQDHGPQGNQDSRGATAAAASLAAIFGPPAKQDSEACAAVLQKSPPIDETNGSDLLAKLSQGKPESQRSSSKSTKTGETRESAQRCPPPPVERTAAKPSGNWADIVRSGAAQVVQAGKRKSDDPFAPGKDEASLSDFVKTKNVKSPHQQKTSRDHTSPTPSPEKKNSRMPILAKSHLDASVPPFSPSTTATSIAEGPKPKLNPAAAAFNAMSPTGSVASKTAPPRGPNGKKKKIDHSVLTVERVHAKKGHAHKPALPGQAKGVEKRFVTPADQILDPSKITQPPPPSKENRRAWPLPDRCNKNAVPNKAPVSSPVSTAAANTSDDNQEKGTLKTATTQVQTTSPKLVGDIHPDAGMKTTNNDGFPTLDQAAATAPAKKRRAASIVKAGIPTTVASAPVSTTVVRRDANNATTQKSGPKQAQGVAKPRQTPVQSSVTAVAPAVTKSDQPKVERTETTEPGPKQNGEGWQTVGGNQNNTGGGGVNRGRSRGHGGSGRGWRGAEHSTRGGGSRGGRGRQGGDMEDRKGG